MNAGAHVLCETPCVYSVEEARRVLEASRRTGRAFMLAEDYIWMGWVVRMKEKAQAGAFGEIVYAEGDYTHDCRDIMLATDAGFVPYAERQKHPGAVKTWRATSLPPIYYTSHTLGPLLHLMDDRIVSAVGMSTGTHTAPDLGTIDLESALFQTAKGAVIRLTNGFTVAHPYSVYYNAVGTRGSMKWSNLGGFVWYTEAETPRMTDWQAAPKEWNDRPDGRNRVEVMVREFVDALVRGAPLPLDACRSLDFVLPGILAHESALAGAARLAVPDPRAIR
jgi:predicted dehydrogenase